MATLDATLAGSTSNSYVDLAEADAIAANLPFAAEWAALTDEEKTERPHRRHPLARNPQLHRWNAMHHDSAI